MFTYELARRLSSSKLPVVANVLDPGVVDTELQRYLPTPVGAGGHMGPGWSPKWSHQQNAEMWEVKM